MNIKVWVCNSPNLFRIGDVIEKLQASISSCSPCAIIHSTSPLMAKEPVLNRWQLKSPQCFNQELLGDPGALSMSKKKKSDQSKDIDKYSSQLLIQEASYCRRQATRKIHSCSVQRTSTSLNYTTRIVFSIYFPWQMPLPLNVWSARGIMRLGSHQSNEHRYGTV